ncbi:MAG: FxsA family protein, partial [Acidiferrobacterales bacterium]
MTQLLFIVFLVVPLVEIWLLIEVGSVIGAIWTVILVVLTAMIGAALVRAQGFATLSRAQAQLRAGELPAVEMFEGVALIVAGALLLTPGFFTDTVGFTLLMPPLRRWLIRIVVERRFIQP